MIITYLILIHSSQIIFGCTNCCDSCGDSTCCNQCQSRCRTTSCLSECRQDCCMQSNSCQTSNCCQSSNCQRKSSCQQASNCFTNCQSRCTQDIDNCSSQCSKTCCGDTDSTNNNCCNTATTIEESRESRIIGNNGAGNSKSDSQLGTNSNNNINNNVTTLININNTVNNENRIEVPIDISNINTVNVNIVPADKTDSVTDSINGNTERNIDIRIEPRTVPVPIPVPIPIPAPQESTTGVPIYQQVPSQLPVLQYPYQQILNQPSCCNMVVPCAQAGCQSVRRTCGSQCTNRFMYLPLNPCQGGCGKRNYAVGNTCSTSGFCRQTMMECSSCDVNNFYNSYQGYQQCGGCFYTNNA